MSVLKHSSQCKAGAGKGAPPANKDIYRSTNGKRDPEEKGGCLHDEVPLKFKQKDLENFVLKE